MVAFQVRHDPGGPERTVTESLAPPDHTAALTVEAARRLKRELRTDERPAAQSYSGGR